MEEHFSAVCVAKYKQEIGATTCMNELLECGAAEIILGAGSVEKGNLTIAVATLNHCGEMASQLWAMTGLANEIEGGCKRNAHRIFGIFDDPGARVINEMHLHFGIVFAANDEEFGAFKFEQGKGALGASDFGGGQIEYGSVLIFPFLAVAECCAEWGDDDHRVLSKILWMRAQAGVFETQLEEGIG